MREGIYQTMHVIAYKITWKAEIKRNYDYLNREHQEASECRGILSLWLTSLELVNDQVAGNKIRKFLL